MVSYRVARTGKPHTIEEDFIFTFMGGSIKEDIVFWKPGQQERIFLKQ
jgi:hypothetical protein